MTINSLDNKTGAKPLLSASALNALRKINFFRSPIPLNIRGKYKVTTRIGGLATILVVVFLMIQLVRYCDDMFNRGDVMLYEIEELEDDPSPVTLGPETNFFLAALITANDVAVNLTTSANVAFKTDLIHSTRISDTTNTRVKVKYPAYWAPCNRSNIPTLGSTFDAYSTYQLAYAFCVTGINLTNTADGTCPQDVVSKYPNCMAPLDIVLRGGILSSEFDYLQINMLPCNSSTVKSAWNMNCNTSSLASQFATTTWKINLYYGNTIVEPKNYKNPSKAFIDTYYWIYSNLSYKVTNVFVDRLIVRNYDSYLSPSVNTNQTYFAIIPTNIKDIDGPRLTNSSALMQINLRRSNVNLITVRTYMEIQDVLIKIGGFSKTILFIATFIVIGYMRFKYLMILSNELYNFEIPLKILPLPQLEDDKPKRAHQLFLVSDPDKREESNLALASGMSPMTSFCAPTSQFTSPLSSPTTTNINTNANANANANAKQESNEAILKYFEHHKKLEKKKLPYGEIHYFKYLLCSLCRKKSVEEQLAAKARQFAAGDLDIVKIMDKLIEVDKLKMLLMNPNQRNMFGAFENPLICLDKKRKLVHMNTYKVYLRSEKENYDKQQQEDLCEEQKKTHHERIEKKVLDDREEFNSLSQYARLYIAYRHLKNDTDPDNRKFNKRLLLMIGSDLLEAFERMDKILGDHVTPLRFENMVKEILKNAHKDKWLPLE